MGYGFISCLAVKEGLRGTGLESKVDSGNLRKTFFEASNEDLPPPVSSVVINYVVDGIPFRFATGGTRLPSLHCMLYLKACVQIISERCNNFNRVSGVDSQEQYAHQAPFPLLSICKL